MLRDFQSATEFHYCFRLVEIHPFYPEVSILLTLLTMKMMGREGLTTCFRSCRFPACSVWLQRGCVTGTPLWNRLLSIGFFHQEISK